MVPVWLLFSLGRLGHWPMSAEMSTRRREACSEKSYDL